MARTVEHGAIIDQAKEYAFNLFNAQYPELLAEHLDRGDRRKRRIDRMSVSVLLKKDFAMIREFLSRDQILFDDHLEMNDLKNIIET